jgi:hypothetical protein
VTSVRDNNTYRTGLAQIAGTTIFFYPTSASGPATSNWAGATNTNGVNFYEDIEVA